MKSFNPLTPAETGRLAALAEECGEVVQSIVDILRHGYESPHPSGGRTNRERLENELGYLQSALRTSMIAGDVSALHIAKFTELKATAARASHICDDRNRRSR